ncbi:hypothetical protein [Bacillus sp. Au-Bac7]|uniref:hypothetical protein n=1 Tax=Bacillus sp. Au-Bac7 TaxID=2906458 RepID=UPI001E39EFF1|nr:hypothetical protein [Bacillus sp. Au-Bac7]MCE4047281.1 hypothetical protein [Bacillus sp. Au-Bac7]
METIVAVERNYLGEIISFKTSNERIISYRKALLEAEEGLLDGIRLCEASYEEGQALIIEDTFAEYPLI